MKKRYILSLFIMAFIVLIGINIIFLDFDNLSFSNNKGTYLGIVSNILMLLVMVLARRKEKRKNQVIN